ncbi:MAG: hypothetical protein M0Z94_07770 [Dehalococcoidales bacterium]|nr:hypothetical protein [Dehalococcoidales bacterium]
MHVVILIAQAVTVVPPLADRLVGLPPGLLIDDGLVLRAILPPVVAYESLVHRIMNNGLDQILTEPLAAHLVLCTATPGYQSDLGSEATGIGLVGHGAGGTRLDDAFEDELDDRRLPLVGLERLRFLGVNEAEGDVAAVPEAFLGSTGHLAHGALTGQLPFELREAEQYVEDQHAHGVGCVEVLSGRDEGDVVRLEDLPELVEVL